MRMNFKSLYRSFIAVLIILVVLTAALCGCKDRNTANQNIKVDITETTDAAYTVREYDGRIAVFSGDNTSPDYVLEAPLIRDLPFSDRKSLNEGVKVYNDAELSEVLQDYDN